MAEHSTEIGWEVFGASVRGASHVRSGLPNQDAVAWESSYNSNGAFNIVAVADGHGSAKSCRSDRGARLAVQIAVELLHEFQQRLGGPKNLAEVKRASEVDLPRSIVQHWREAVAADEPLTMPELDRLTAKDRSAVEADRHVAYGATLLAALVTDRFALYLQLGDGDVLAVSDEGTVSRPLPPDERNFANETMSLCSTGSTGGKHLPSAGAGAWSEFRQRFQPLERPPALVLLSTDGYANSFRSDGDFLKVGADLLSGLRAEGVEEVKNNLPEWLSLASAEGSGDDVTLALIYRRPVPSKADDNKSKVVAGHENQTSPTGEQVPAATSETTGEQGKDETTGNQPKESRSFFSRLFRRE